MYIQSNVKSNAKTENEPKRTQREKRREIAIKIKYLASKEELTEEEKVLLDQLADEYTENLKENVSGRR